MSRYSVLFPPKKYHEIGPFRLPVYNSLMPGESRQIEDMARNEANTRFASVKLAKKISADKGITMDEAVDLLSSMKDTQDKSLIYDYLEEIEELNSGARGEVTQKAELVTIVLRFRGEVRFPESEEYVPLKDWAPADTDVLPTETLNAIFDFVIWERDGWPQPGKPEATPPSPPKSTTMKS